MAKAEIQAKNRAKILFFMGLFVDELMSI
jgi:hypothetical protein